MRVGDRAMAALNAHPHERFLASQRSPAITARRVYDHRFRQAICETGDPGLFDSVVSIPRGTAKSWLRRGRPRVVSLDEGDFEAADALQAELMGMGVFVNDRKKTWEASK